MYSHVAVGIILLIYFIYQVCKHRDDLSYLVSYFFYHDQFVKEATKDAIDRELRGNNIGFKEQYRSNEKWRKETMLSYNKQFSGSSTKLKNSILQAAFTVVRVLLVSFGAAYLSVVYFPLNKGVTLLIQIGSASLILWALIGKLGWSLQTWKGETLPERINDFWCTLLNVSGVLLLFFALFYDLLEKHA